MSRIIQSIIESGFSNRKIKNPIIFFHPNEIDLDVLNFETQLIGFNRHPGDTNNKIKIITENDINNQISFSPDIIINCWLGVYQNSKNLSNIFRIPHINIFKKNCLELKKEPLFELAAGPLLEDINIVESEDMANVLYLTDNYYIKEKNLEQQIMDILNDKKG